MTKKDFSKQMKNIEDLNQKMAEESMARCAPVVAEIYKMMAETDLELGAATEGRTKKYKDMAKRIQELFLAHNLKWFERTFIFQLMRGPIEALEAYVVADLNLTYDRALCSQFGVFDMGELDFKVIDEKLKLWTEQNKGKKPKEETK